MKNDVQTRVAVFALTIVLGLPVVSPGAEEGPAKLPSTGYGPKTEEERAIAESIRQEDERELAKLGESRLVTEEGKVYFPPEIDEQTLPWDVGRFATKDRVYQLLLDQPDIYKQLKAYNTKSVKLSGRIRGGGKYFIVTAFYVPLKVPSTPPKRGGM